MKKTLVLWLGVILFFAVLIAFGLRGREAPPGTDSKESEKPLAPMFSLNLLGGEGKFDFPEAQRKPTLLNFTASWCQVCVEEAPGLGRIYKRYKNKDFVFIGIYIQDTEEKAKEHAEKFGLTFTSGIDVDGSVASMYGVSGVPTHVFVDSKGRISYRHIGLMMEKEFSQRIEEILG